ncbi:hypothetical protein I5677_06770 [Mobilitalea sibirica]|uniref:Uncharacterized protein n=1 Tax=Mobilitalea sibirica TaxID=1462919 RepID=A0A8J7HB18_9FIRM|nr:hypothetical protein [Mobilitalea sibirica]MBH1940586.1 hypothetical protein [Mobilitalea sibirica]
MGRIFIGFLFVFLNFNFNLNASTIGLIPDFIGYILIHKGLYELSLRSQWFGKVKPYVRCMVLFTAVIYVFDLLGISVSMGYLSLFLGLVSTIISLYITYSIVMGIQDMEKIYQWKLKAETLFMVWKLIAICSFLTYLALIAPLLGFMGMVAGFIFHIVFLYYFNISKGMYESQVNS